MPMFGRASQAPQSGDGWNEVDTLDVDLLAEYLLNDSQLMSNGVTFDFNMESGYGSTVVSPGTCLFPSLAKYDGI